MKKLILGLTILFAATSVFALTYKVIAIVDGASISSMQVRDRVQLVISSSGMKDDAETRRKTTLEVMDILINEALEKEDAKAKNISVSDAEVKDVLGDLEKGNNLKPGGFKDFISSKGISYNSVIDQIKSNILWKKVLGRYVRPTISVSDEDIAKAKEYKPKPKAPDKVAVNVSEIIIPIEYGKEKDAKDLADTIVRTVRSKAKDFGELAQKYSVGKTSAKKGLVGWMPEEGMVENLSGPIKATKAGDVTDPIKVKSIYVILKINERKSVSQGPQEKPMSAEDRAFSTKMEDGAKKYIKNLRDNAYIEKKYKDDSDLMTQIWSD